MLGHIAFDQRKLEQPAGLLDKKRAEMSGVTVEERRQEQREFLAGRVEIVNNRLKELED
jgi:hypothetical protein